MDPQYLHLIASPRVSQQTRDALLSRTAIDDPEYVPIALTVPQLQTLRTLVAVIIPQQADTQNDDAPIDIAARLDQTLAADKADGWRYATLPMDVDAYRQGLSILNDWMQSPENKPESLLHEIYAGQKKSPAFDLQRWFEDLRANATQIFVSHPQTLARMGYSGIADDPSGFVSVGIGAVEPWEPKAKGTEMKA